MNGSERYKETTGWERLCVSNGGKHVVSVPKSGTEIELQI
jgi:hypothetical protein